MRTVKEQLLAYGFSESFSPQVTERFRESKKDENGLCKISYVYRQDGDYKLFRFTDWSGSGYVEFEEVPEKFAKKDRDRVSKNLKSFNKKLEEDRENAHRAAKLEAQRIWDAAHTPEEVLAADPDFVPAYLKQKGLTHFKDYRLERGNVHKMILPIVNDKLEIESLQFLTPAGKENLTGGKIEGNFGFIKGDADSAPITEGFATALSVHQATGATVYFTISSTNMVKAAQHIQTLENGKIIIVCADDDRHLPDNIGLNAGRKTADKYGFLLRSPSFMELDGKKTTDFDDVRRLYGVNEVRKQLELSEQEIEKFVVKPGYTPLGFSGSTYYFISTQCRQVQGFEALTQEALTSILEMEYWETHESEEDYEGNLRVDWARLGSKLKATCHKKGVYNGENLRGVGIYLDQGRKVVHLGESLLVDGIEKKLTQIKSKYLYIQSGPEITYSKEQLSDAEAKALYDVFDLVTLEHTFKKDFLLGWPVCAVIAGALAWRAHIYLSGPRGSGKTQIGDFIAKLLDVTFAKLQFTGVQSTAVGVRQKIMNRALPIIVDEVEGDSKKTKGIAEGVLQILRVASSNSKATTVIGSSDQNAKEFTVIAAGMLIGIDPQLKQQSDKSRFTMIETKTPKNITSEQKMANWNIVQSEWNKVDEVWGKKFLARIVENLDIILWNIKTLGERLRNEGFEAREAEQNSSLLAASLIYKHTNKISEEEIKYFLGILEHKKEEEDVRTTGESDCLKYILETVLQDEEHKKIQIYMLLTRDDISDYMKDQLAMYGITIVDSKKVGKGLHFRSTSHLDERMQNTPWALSYMERLKGSPNAIKALQVRVRGFGQKWGVFIPMDVVQPQMEDEVKPEVRL